MRTTMKLVTAFALAVAPVVAAAGPARAGGGGCHEGATQGTGSTIRIVDACFTPTVLHVQPGEIVTWVNDDMFIHNITANGWGHFDDVQPLERYAATFDQGGLFPYSCTIHPGMSGVIVVGSGTGPGNGTTVDVAAPIEAAAPAALVSGEAPAASNGWAAPAAIGVLLGLVAGLGLAEVRRRATGAGPTR
jgi:plastocyanin